MRVIAGEARGRRLEALPGTDVTRPTLSQVKEAMFSIVQFDLPGARVLDLVMKKFEDTGAWNLPVIEEGRYIGFVSKAKIFNTYRRVLQHFSDE